MITKRIDLYEYFNKERKENFGGYLEVYAPLECCAIDEHRKRPAILVIPGGGYAHVSKREAEPIAFRFMAEGFSAFCLEYTVYPNGIYPTQLLEACMAMAYIRENADEFEIKKDKISAIGFSAGAHLASTLHCLYDDEVVKNYLGERASLCRPDAVIFGYGVLTYDKKAPCGSLRRLSGFNEELAKTLSMDKKINKKVCPAFLFATFEDTIVPMENTLKYATALRKKKIPFEMRIYEKGIHGFSTATGISCANSRQLLPRTSKWMEDAIGWLTDRDFKIESN